MRKQLKQEIITERFDVAQEMQQQILILEERDKKKAHTSMQHDFDLATEQLQKRQQQDIMFLKEYLKQSDAQILQKREKLRASFMFRAKKIQQQRDIVQDIDKVWKQKQMQRKDELSRGPSQVRRSMPSRRIRMTDMEGNGRLFSQNTNDSSITLPPLNFSKIPKTPRNPKPPLNKSTRSPRRF